jgi:hypothetical protein
MNCKGSGRKRIWPNFKVISLNFPEMIEENHDDFSSK